MAKSRAETLIRELRALLVAVPEDAEPPADYGDVTVYEDDDGNVLARLYVGSYLALDPCGRYHHILSPNVMTIGCESFWDAVDRWSDELGVSIVAGDGDPTDVFAVRLIR